MGPNIGFEFRTPRSRLEMRSRPEVRARPEVRSGMGRLNNGATQVLHIPYFDMDLVTYFVILKSSARC